MGFDVNFNNKPMIQSAQSSQDGGAGNLGYFEQGEKENKEKKRDKSIFKDETDSFKKSSAEESHDEEFSISRFIARVILTVQAWLKKIFA